MTTIPLKPSHKKRNLIIGGSVIFLLLASQAVAPIQKWIADQVPYVTISGFAESESDYHPYILKMDKEWNEALAAVSAKTLPDAVLETTEIIPVDEYGEANEKGYVTPQPEDLARYFKINALYFDTEEEAKIANLALFDYYTSKGYATIGSSGQNMSSAPAPTNNAYKDITFEISRPEENLIDKPNDDVYLANPRVSGLVTDYEGRWMVEFKSSAVYFHLSELPQLDGNSREPIDYRKDWCPSSDTLGAEYWTPEHGCLEDSADR